MNLYEIIFDFFYNVVGLNATDLEAFEHSIAGNSVGMGSWLAHSASIVTICVLVFVAFRFVWWLCKLVAHAFQMRG